MILRIFKTWLCVVGVVLSAIAILLISASVGVWVQGPLGVLVGVLTFCTLVVAEIELVMRRMGV